MEFGEFFLRQSESHNKDVRFNLVRDYLLRYTHFDFWKYSTPITHGRAEPSQVYKETSTVIEKQFIVTYTTFEFDLFTQQKIINKIFLVCLFLLNLNRLYFFYLCTVSL